MINQPKSRGCDFKVHFWNFPVTLGKWLDLLELVSPLKEGGGKRNCPRGLL